MNEWWPAVCCSVWIAAPIIAFVLGIKIGKGELQIPFRVRIERRGEEDYSVDVE